MNTMLSSSKSVSLKIAEMLPLVTGVLLALFALFSIPVDFAVSHRQNDLGSRLLWSAFILTIAIGFLLPRAWLKLLASLLLAGWATWLFAHDLYAPQNWWIYLLLFVPLLSMIWLLRVGRGSSHRRLADAN